MSGFRPDELIQRFSRKGAKRAATEREICRGHGCLFLSVRGYCCHAGCKLNNIPAMLIERSVPLFRLKIRIAGSGLLVLVIEHRADQMKRCAAPNEPRSYGSAQIVNSQILKPRFRTNAAPH